MTMAVAYRPKEGNAKFQLMKVCESQDVILFPLQFTGPLDSMQKTAGVHGPHVLSLPSSRTAELQAAYENSLLWL